MNRARGSGDSVSEKSAPAQGYPPQSVGRDALGCALLGALCRISQQEKLLFSFPSISLFSFFITHCIPAKTCTVFPAGISCISS